MGSLTSGSPLHQAGLPSQAARGGIGWVTLRKGASSQPLLVPKLHTSVRSVGGMFTSSSEMLARSASSSFQVQVEVYRE